MRRLTRYVLVEFFKVFCVALVVMASLLLLGVVLIEAVRQGLASPSAILRLLPFAVPTALLYSIPGTTLFAVCSIYGRMSAANEFTAVKAAGVSPLTLVRPILLVSLLLSGLVVWLNDVAVSWGRTGINRVLLESVEQIVYGMLRTQKSYSSPGITINVRGVDGHRLLWPTVTLRLGNGPPMNILAEEAELHGDATKETLTIVLRNCEFSQGKLHGTLPGENVRVVPLAEAARRGLESGRPADTPLARIPAAIREQQERLGDLERLFAAEASLQILTGDLPGLLGPEWNDRHEQLTAAQANLQRLKTEPWRRFANGFTCFFFALVGIPLAVLLRTGFVWNAFAICFLPILVVYYPLLMYGVDLAKTGRMPPQTVWLGNGVMLVVGYGLMRRMMRY